MNILDEIAAKTCERTEAEKKKVPLEMVRRIAEEKAAAEKAAGNGKFHYRFQQALAGEDISFICEVKKASPSKGIIAEDFPYLQIAREYEQAGASAISCLTEPFWFLGKDAYLKEITDQVQIPVLRKDFTIDEYPPKLMLIDNETGRALPEKSPVHLLLEEEVYGGTLQDWELTIQQSIPMAASVATEDTLKFTDFHSMGATYAVHLKAVNRKNRQTKEGWVSCGSFLFPYKALRLDSLTSLVMPEREPQRFASKVKVYTQEGTITEDTIEVNRPMEIEGWKIYQLSYDESKGGWSDISIFELVRDPWLPVVYTGIVMMMLGAVCLFVNAQKRKEEEKE